MENKPVEITIVDNGKEIKLNTPWDSDLEDWEHNFRVILKWLTFSEEQIDELFKGEEYDK